MKKNRFILTAVAFSIAIAGAFASANLTLTSAWQDGPDTSTDCESGTLLDEPCQTTQTNNGRCRVQFGSTIVNDAKTTSCGVFYYKTNP